MCLKGESPNENREVVLYDHFAGDNSSLKFIIKFRKNKASKFLLYATETVLSSEIFSSLNLSNFAG